MGRVFVTSDGHLGHANILKLKNGLGGALLRPQFNDVTEMNEELVRKWNNVVTNDDVVYHLGDVAWNRQALTYISACKGRKVLILGSHDTLDFAAYAKHFDKIRLDAVFAKWGITLHLSHMPLHKASFPYGCEETTLNVHGHTHAVHVPGPYHNVCVENTDYTPVLLDDLYDIAFKKLNVAERATVEELTA